jgi:hypothetical protein
MLFIKVAAQIKFKDYITQHRISNNLRFQYLKLANIISKVCGIIFAFLSVHKYTVLVQHNELV